MRTIAVRKKETLSIAVFSKLSTMFDVLRVYKSHIMGIKTNACGSNYFFPKAHNQSTMQIDELFFKLRLFSDESNSKFTKDAFH